MLSRFVCIVERSARQYCAIPLPVRETVLKSFLRLKKKQFLFYSLAVFCVHRVDFLQQGFSRPSGVLSPDAAPTPSRSLPLLLGPHLTSCWSQNTTPANKKRYVLHAKNKKKQQIGIIFLFKMHGRLRSLWWGTNRRWSYVVGRYKFFWKRLTLNISGVFFFFFGTVCFLCNLGNFPSQKNSHKIKTLQMSCWSWHLLVRVCYYILKARHYTQGLVRCTLQKCGLVSYLINHSVVFWFILFWSLFVQANSASNILSSLRFTNCPCEHSHFVYLLSYITGSPIYQLCKRKTKCQWGGAGPDLDPSTWVESGRVEPKVLEMEVYVYCVG